MLLRARAARLPALAAPSLLRRGLASQPPPLLELPAVSARKERIKQHGLLGLTAPFVEQLKEDKGRRRQAPSFRVQQYAVDTGRPTEFALTSVYGYGRVRAKRLQAEVGLHGHYPLSRMRESQREYIRRTVNDSCVAYDEPERAAGAALRKDTAENIQRLIDIGSYRGFRHSNRLPCRGQRTKTNAKTRRKMPVIHLSREKGIS